MNSNPWCNRWRVVDHEFQQRPVQTKDYEISICCFSVKHGPYRNKNKDWLARNQDNVSGVM